MTGGMLEKVPTAPERFPMLIRFLAAFILSRFLLMSSYQSANLRPKVIGSAWTPWLRPMQGVFLYLKACLFMTLKRSLISLMMISEASFMRRDCAVSTMSDEV